MLSNGLIGNETRPGWAQEQDQANDRSGDPGPRRRSAGAEQESSLAEAAGDDAITTGYQGRTERHAVALNSPLPWGQRHAPRSWGGAKRPPSASRSTGRARSSA